MGLSGGRWSTCNWSWDSQCRVKRLFLMDQMGAELRECIIYTLFKGENGTWQNILGQWQCLFIKNGTVRHIGQAQTIDEHASQQLQSFCVHRELRKGTVCTKDKISSQWTKAKRQKLTSKQIRVFLKQSDGSRVKSAKYMTVHKNNKTVTVWQSNPEWSCLIRHNVWPL